MRPLRFMAFFVELGWEHDVYYVVTHFQRAVMILFQRRRRSILDTQEL
jgi:hypothetical protein